MLLRSLAMKSRKGLARDIFGTFAKHVDMGLVYDVTNTDFWAQNCSTLGRVFAIFKRQFLTQDEKSTQKLLSVCMRACVRACVRACA